MDLSPRLRVLLFGDSLTQRGFAPGGWAARLADACQRRADVCNRGLSGYNTRWAARAVGSVLPDGACAGGVGGTVERPDLLTLFFGANDAVLPGLKGTASRQHVPVAEYERRLGDFIARARHGRAHSGAGACVVCVLTPPPVDEPARLAWEKENHDVRFCGENVRTTAHASEYAAAARRAAAAAGGAAGGVLLCDVFEAFMRVRAADPAEFSKLFDDGLHFTAAGNLAVYEALEEAMQAQAPALWQKLTAPDAPTDFPLNPDIDPDDPDAAFKAHTAPFC